MNPPIVSICIPVYNGERYVREALDSAFKQTYSDYEIVVVDNQSTDATVSIIHSYKDPRIKFFQNSTNIGMVANWDMVLQKATGKYIKILPADDLLYPDCLALQVPILENDTLEKISMVCSRRDIIDDGGKVLFTRGFSRKQIEVDGPTAINRNVRSGGNIIGESGSILFRRSIIAKTGGFKSEILYMNDLFLWYKILLHGNLYSLPNVVSAFRLSSASESVNIKNRQRSDVAAFNKTLYESKQYGLSLVSYRVGLLNNYLITQAKKVLYSFLKIKS